MRFFPITSFFKLFSRNLSRIFELIQLSRHNNFTIGGYFRNQGAQIGENCSIMIRSLGDEPYLIKIGNHVGIAGGVTFLTHDNGVWIFRDEIPDLQAFGPIIIEDNCIIGQNATLFPNIRICENSIVAAGAVVISDIPPNSIALGAPARVISSIERFKKKCIENWEEQRPPDIIIEEGHDWWNSKHFKKNREKLKRHLTRIFWDQEKSRNK